MDEGVHVRRVEIVLLVPGGRRQHDVGIDACRGHAEVESHQEVELAPRPLVAPDNFLRLFVAFLAEILAEHPVIGTEQVLEEIFMPLSRRTQQVGAPHEEVARPVVRVVGIVAGKLQLARFQRRHHVIRRLLPLGLRPCREFKRIGLELRRRR